MAGIPLKSGADFYVLEAARMRLHNLGADPTEYGDGLIYFNNSDGNNTSRRARIYDGTTFRSLAFLDEIANNEAFNTLVGRVDEAEGDIDSLEGRADALEALFSGSNAKVADNALMLGGQLPSYYAQSSVLAQLRSEFDALYKTLNDDTTGVIDTWQEVVDFVNEYSGSEDLSTILAGMNTQIADRYTKAEADGRFLKLTGGTISGELNINSQTDTTKRRLLIWYYASDRKNRGAMSVSENNVQLDYYSPTDEAYYYIRIGRDGLKYSANHNEKDILHSGNVMNYNAGGITSGVATDDYLQGRVAKAWYDWNTNTGNGADNYSYGIYVGAYDTGYGMQLATIIGSVSFLRARVKRNSAWENWKTIAFTDSDITGNAATATRANYLATQKGESNDWYADQYKIYAKWINEKTCEWRVTDGAYEVSVDIAKRLSTARTIWGQSFDGTEDVSGDLNLRVSKLFFNGDAANYFITCQGTALATYNMFGGHSFCTAGGTQRMLINTTGNVTIGDSDLAGSNRKLFVNGSASFVIGTQNNITTSDELDLTKTFTITAEKTTSNSGLHAWINTSGCVNLQSSYAAFAANKTVYPISLNPLGGNVGIGTTKPDEKLHIVGNLHVTGNIIADGELSAGGAGEEGETESTGNASAWAQTFVPTNTTMPFEHNRATTDVIVQVYEKNDGGSWDMILVDVEIISETKVNLHFGRTENREHKIVIMG